MTGLATYTDAIVTLRPSQLQKLESLGLYYNSPEPAIICIECGFAINPTRAPTSLLSVPLSVKVETPVVCGSTSYGIGGGGVTWHRLWQTISLSVTSLQLGHNRD
ncbi:hypothetical protein NOF04DRAFT_1335906, partial [Fusarium oxysporum II5]